MVRNNPFKFSKFSKFELLEATFIGVLSVLNLKILYQMLSKKIIISNLIGLFFKFINEMELEDIRAFFNTFLRKGFKFNIQKVTPVGKRLERSHFMLPITEAVPIIFSFL